MRRAARNRRAKSLMCLAHHQAPSAWNNARLPPARAPLRGAAAGFVLEVFEDEEDCTPAHKATAPAQVPLRKKLEEEARTVLLRCLAATTWLTISGLRRCRRDTGTLCCCTLQLAPRLARPCAARPYRLLPHRRKLSCWKGERSIHVSSFASQFH